MTMLSFASSIARRSTRSLGRGPLLGLALVALALTGCTDVRRSIGLDRTSPDEFTVVSRAPLTMPPSLARLPEPRPGAARPQDATSAAVAAASVFGGSSRATAATAAGHTAGESALIAQAGAKSGIEQGIRNKVDQETTQLVVADKSWIDSLLFWQTQQQPYEIVDPKKENQRLREAQATGKALNDGTVPTIERKRRAPLEGLF
ncbi:DUF3035 domain-containing protein [Azospirillum brasilense]|uniref:DUF3035 domain-containing protein n=2 Tax=Azospirillum brasilense TaxID=192 RepID=A0A4D8QIH6_AZOBR|nr:DUF3035 domain-containing protein [Azospirillum brasilense]NUB31079.1 DUF3035 domain-containing protein [Azospirillum brasilense]QCO08483.1 DUF3035 domain-containing protein [Azospirillum brasilense]QEL89540.1 DUF3035 domain-containing protein [Azospirillum brasilense]QEL95787.1 DUF3035 domain-containing protein [Azospirillum brasilense]